MNINNTQLDWICIFDFYLKILCCRLLRSIYFLSSSSSSQTFTFTKVALQKKSSSFVFRTHRAFRAPFFEASIRAVLAIGRQLFISKTRTGLRSNGWHFYKNIFATVKFSLLDEPAVFSHKFPLLYSMETYFTLFVEMSVI